MELLYESTDSQVFRQEHGDEGIPVAIKVLKKEYPSAGHLARLINEYELCKDLTCSGVRRVYRRSLVDGKHALVMQYVAGKPLKR